MLIILSHVPVWVLALLAVLIVFGIQALRPRTVALPRLLVIPVIFTGWGLYALLVRASVSPLLGFDWLVAAAIGVALAWRFTRLDLVQIDPLSRRVSVPGSRAPLIRNLTVFVAKFAARFATAMLPAAASRIAFYDVAVSGLVAGYFLTWMLWLLVRYRESVSRSYRDGPRPPEVADGW